MLFKQYSRFKFRFVVLLFISVILMVYDKRAQQKEPIHVGLTALLAPFQYGVSNLFSGFAFLANSVSSHQTLIKQNNLYQQKLLLQQTQIQQLNQLKKENKQLLLLLAAKQRLPNRVKLARILTVATDASWAQAVIDQGKRAGIFIGQPVINAQGVMGQVIEVGWLTSKVMLLTDVRSAIPVEDVRSGVYAIAAGNGESHYLSLMNVPETADIKANDRLITSGWGLVYPAGYPVGSVLQVKNKPGRQFADVQVKPAANLSQSQQVLLIWLANSAVNNAAKQTLNKAEKDD